MKRTIPKAIILLLVIYAISFLTDLYRTIFYTTRPDYLLYETLGVGYLFFAFRVPVVIIEGSIIWFSWKAKSITIWLFVAQLVLATVNSVMYYFMAVKNLDIAREAYVAYRHSQGLNASLESIETILSPTGLLMALVFTIVYFLILAALFFWKRGYFFSQENRTSYAI